MNVKIYGSTCPQTKLFYGYFKNLFSEYGIDADFELITNLRHMNPYTNPLKMFNFADFVVIVSQNATSILPSNA